MVFDSVSGENGRKRAKNHHRQAADGDSLININLLNLIMKNRLAPRFTSSSSRENLLNYEKKNPLPIKCGT